ncbi:tyrosine-protein phosphatase [Novosphingobium sp. Chol11]|jgi:protein-tyrosine phosphatase|uniref:tyrosine-protein phosphatase n=1 Tax=Novosphingobium sp. Chol11 TaxID=1385763 RepID=UPI000BE27A48|nr:tyrosine-protein phosphatase [Novosphingobium sp. Chol11]
MTALLLDRRAFVTAALAVSVAGLAGCATPASEARSGPIPFLTATAAKVGTSDDYQIAWDAAGVDHVVIYAGSTPSPVLTGEPVARGRGKDSITVSMPAVGARPYFTLVPDRGAPLVIADRALHLPSIANLRDIGGYRTTDGRWVKMGLLFRSDQLDRVSDADLKAMEELRLRLVADLRTQSERTREPDRLPRGSQPLILDVAGDSEGSLGGDMRKAMAAIAAGKGAELLTAANRDFVSLGSARRAYAGLLDELNGAPILYHCTAGKDRTGWASAVILTLLGVPRETVMADYLASNVYLQAKNERAKEMLAKSNSPIDPAHLDPVMTVRASYLEAAFDEVAKRYGSFDAYVREGLGLGDAEMEALRSTYLQG